MKLTPTSIARRPGTGGFATALEFKRAILAESEGVLKKVTAMSPEEFSKLPIRVALVVKTHRDRVAKYTREIAEIEAGENGQPDTFPSVGLTGVKSPVDLAAPAVPAATANCLTVDISCTEAVVAPAANGDQRCDLPPDGQPDSSETGTPAFPSDTVVDSAESAEGQLSNPVEPSDNIQYAEVVPNARNSAPGNKFQKIEEARELLGVWQAIEIMPNWCPDEWTQRPELATARSFAHNRRWRCRTDKGDIIDLVRIMFGDPDELMAANRIIEMVSAMPADLREFCHPDNIEPKQEEDYAAELTPLPEIEDAADFLGRDVPEPPELVEGILHQGSKMILAGSSKSFKTWSLLDLALSVAYGREWLGFATQQGAVLYINLEIAGAFFGRRIRTIATEKSVTIEHGRLSIMNLRGHAADLSKLLPQLLVSIRERRYALIILDPIYKVLGGRDENDAGHIAGLLNDLERLAVETSAAVVFAAHYSKGSQAGKASIDRMSGSGVFARDPDTILALTQHEQENAFTVEATLRNHPPIAPFVVRWRYPLMERDGGLDPRKLKQISGRPKAHTADDLLKVLGDRELSFSAWKAAALKADISETTFKSLRRELVDSGQVSQSEETNAYRRALRGEKGL